MAKALPTIWALEEHTRAKHELLTRYLSRWVPIFQHGYGKTGDLVLIDGFAGPGVYANEEPGSPVLMIRQYLNAPRDPSTRLHCFFSEGDPKRAIELERRVGGFRGPNCHVEVLSGDYASHYARVMAYVDRLDDPAVSHSSTHSAPLTILIWLSTLSSGPVQRCSCISQSVILRGSSIS